MRALFLFCLVNLMQLTIVAHESSHDYFSDLFIIPSGNQSLNLGDVLEDVTAVIYRKEALEKKLKLTSQQAGVPTIEESDPALGEKLNDYLQLAKIYIYGVNGQFNRKKARLLLEEAKSFKVLLTEPSQERIEEIYALLNSCRVPCSEEEKKRTGQNLKDV